MSIRNILHEIEQADPQVFEKTGDRRNILKHFGTKVAIAALPIAIGSMFKKARAAADTTVPDALNVMLIYKFMEVDFYTNAGALLSSLISPADQAAIAVIVAQENAHAAQLQKALSSIGAASALRPAFDFTAHGTFPDVFSNYTTFMAVAQMIEDAGVRVLKGQLPMLVGNKDVLATALRIHSTEGRHAAHIRLMRRLYFSNRSAKPWITTNQTANIDIGAVQMAYAGEENATQSNINITALMGVNGYVTLNAATEAFDEPLAKEQANQIVQLFTA